MNKRFIRSFMIYGLASGLSKSIMIFLLPIYTRIFSPEEYGVIDLIHTVMAFLALGGMLQLQTAVARHFYENTERSVRARMISSTFWTVLAASILLMIVTWIVAPWLSQLLFNTTEYAPILFVAALIIPVSNIFTYLVTSVRYLERPMMYGVLISIQLLTTIGVAVYLVVIRDIGMIGVFYGELAGFGIGALCVAFVLRSYLVLAWDNSTVLKYLAYSIPLLPAVLGSWINSYANRFVVMGYLNDPLHDIGIYSVALKIASVFKLMEQAFRLSLGPFIWKKLQEPNHREIYQSTMKWVAVVVFLLIAVYSLFARELVLLLSTPKYIYAAELVGLICLGIGTNMLYPIVSVGINVVKKTIYNSITLFVSVAVNVGVLLILVPQMGLMGVPIALICGAVTMSSLAWLIGEHLYPVGFPVLYGALPFLLALIIVSGVVVLQPDIMVRIGIAFVLIVLAAIWLRINYEKLQIGSDE